MNLDQTRNWGGGGGEKEKMRGEGESMERSSTFLLNFSAIGPSVSIGARGKVFSHGESFEQRPESGIFEKL